MQSTEDVSPRRVCLLLMEENSSSLPFKNIHYLFQCDIEDVFNMLTDEIGETIPCSIHAHVLHSFQQNCVRIRIACILLNDRNHASFVVASNEKRPLEVKKFDYSRIYTIFCIAYMAITMHNAKTFQKLNTFWWYKFCTQIFAMQSCSNQANVKIHCIGPLMENAEHLAMPLLPLANKRGSSRFVQRLRKNGFFIWIIWIP